MGSVSNDKNAVDVNGGVTAIHAIVRVGSIDPLGCHMMTEPLHHRRDH